MNEGRIKSIPANWVYPLATNHTLCRTIWFAAFLLVWNTHSHPTVLQSFGSMVDSHVPSIMSKSYSFCIMASHLLASFDFIALCNFNGSSKHSTFTLSLSCWGKMWLLRHSSGWQCSFVGYLQSLPNISPPPALFSVSPSITSSSESPTHSLRFSPSSPSVI